MLRCGKCCCIQLATHFDTDHHKNINSFLHIQTLRLLSLRGGQLGDQINACVYYIAEAMKNLLAFLHCCVEQAPKCMHAIDDVNHVSEARHGVFEENIHSSDDVRQDWNACFQVVVDHSLQQIGQLVNRLR